MGNPLNPCQTFGDSIKASCELMVSNNQRGVSRYIFAATRIFFKWLKKRGGRKLLDWDKFNLFMKLYPPPKAIIHHKLFILQTSK